MGYAARVAGSWRCGGCQLGRRSQPSFVLFSFIIHYSHAELIIGQLKGSPIDAMDNDGNSPLHLAAQGTYCALVILLLSKGASSSAVNKNGQRPYSLAPDSNTRWGFHCYRVRS